jgi:serine/threonine protein kinase
VLTFLFGFPFLLPTASFYLAPEIMDKGGYGTAVDLWACGVVLYIMLCGRFPFWGKTDIEYLASLQRGPDMTGDGWGEVSDLGKTFLKALLQLSPSRRLTADQALVHPWIVGAEDSSTGRLGGGKLDKKLSSLNGMAELMSKQKSARALAAEAAQLAVKSTGNLTDSPTGAKEAAIQQ